MLIASLACAVCSAASVTTQHMDNFRTGWNPDETALTVSNVNSSDFSQQAVVQLDEQVDGQPLVFNNVLYVATELNSVYAIDGSTGAILASRSEIDPPVAATTIPPGTCHNNSSSIGINSTPVIDTSAGTLYVVTATPGSGAITHYLHALDLSTLQDKTTPLAIASPPGVTYSRQRSALTLFNGGVLVPFASFCDNNATASLGFISYANVSSGQTAFQSSLYTLSTVWMSGGGPAVSGDYIYFSTGNEENTYPIINPPTTNLPDSIVRLQGSSSGPPALSFSTAITPDPSLLGQDQDFGAGAILIVPAGAPGSITASTPAQFVIGVSKPGGVYVNSPALTPVQSFSPGGTCHCGSSYFTGADGEGYVVTGTGTSLGLYQVSSGGLGRVASASLPPKAFPDPGVFTTVSSNGLAAGSGIIWAVTGPDANYVLSLYAFAASNMARLYTSQAGWWSNTGGNSFTMPVVANGHVYVASNSQLTIWGLSSGLLPAPPTDVGTDGSSDCPLMGVSWTPSAGAASYRVYFQPWGEAINGSRRLKYSGSATSVAVTGGGNQLVMVTVTACNQNGSCSDPSVPTFGKVQRPCP